MTRFERKNRTDIIIKGQGSINDLLDDGIKTIWRINDDEYDFIALISTDEELDKFIIKPKPSISDLKESINLVNDMLVKFNKLKKIN